MSHEWVAIGEFTIDSGSFLICDPAMSKPFADDWYEDLESETFERLPGNFEEITYDDDESASPATVLLINTRCDGTYVVEARFCDYLDNGTLEVCEVRISIHGHEHDVEATS